jgi:hypothetical protein
MMMENMQAIMRFHLRVGALQTRAMVAAPTRSDTAEMRAIAREMIVHADAMDRKMAQEVINGGQR